MELLKQFYREFNACGFDLQNNKKYGWKMASFVIICSILFIDNVLQVVYGWYIFVNRVEGLRNSVFYGLFLIYVYAYISSWDKIQNMFAAIKHGAYTFPYSKNLKSKERTQTETQIITSLLKLGFYIKTFQIVYAVLSCSLPTIFAIKIFLKAENPNSIQVDKLPLPYKFYYPDNCKKLQYYIFAYSLQISWGLFALHYHYLANVMPASMMLFLANEIKLLTLSLNEMDLILQPSIIDCFNDQEMRKYIRYISQFHQCIYRNVKAINESYQCILFFYNFMITFIICVPLYMLTQEEGFRSKSTEVVLIIIGTLALYLFNYSAQRITTEEERFSISLLHCNWLDKPEWFKKSLLIMMIRLGHRSEIKPFGLFLLSLTNFSLTVNAAYSYFNLLRKV